MVRNRIKDRRQELGMTQEQLAEQSGVGQSSISEIEAGKHTPSLEVAILLARALGIAVEDLFIID